MIRIMLMMMVVVVTESRSVVRSMVRVEVQCLRVHNRDVLVGMDQRSPMLVNIVDVCRSVVCPHRNINMDGHFVVMMNMIRMRLNPSWRRLRNGHPLLQLNWSPDFLPVCDIHCLWRPRLHPTRFPD